MAWSPSPPSSSTCSLERWVPWSPEESLLKPGILVYRSPPSPTMTFVLPLPPQGYLEWSPLFYGFYPPRSNLAITYLCSVFAIGFIYLLFILHRLVMPTS